MHSLISIVGVVLSRKENYPKWSRKIKYTLIFNELWKGVCVGDGDKELEQPTSNKEFAIWENKNSKAYALIATSVNEEVSRHISPFSNAFEALQKLKELYDSHFTLEAVQLMIKLFNLELQNDDPLALASEVKSIMHDIKVTNVELDIPLIAFLKAVYPTYSNYLESLQANGNLKDITFDSLVKKFAEREKDFGKKTTPQSSEEVVCLAHRENNLAQDSSRGRGGRRGRGRRNFKGKGDRHSQGEKSDLHCIRCKRDGSHDASTCKLPWDRIEQERNQPKGKTNDKEKIKAPESAHYVMEHYKSKLKPSGLGTIRLKLPGLPDFLLHHVLYLPQLRRNLLSLVHIRQQGQSIHFLDGKVEARKASDHSLVMTGIEEERLLKLQGTSAHAQNFSYNSHYDEGGIPILDQPVESSFEAHSPPHETPTTDDTLSDMIDRIGRLNLDSVPTQSTEQPGPSQKSPPKWLTKTLESVHPDEVGKTGTRNSTRQNGGDVDDSDSPVDMDVSYDCELNLSTDFEPTSFEEVASYDEWKEAMQKEYDALIKNGTWKLVDPPLGTKPIGYKWVYKNKYKVDGSLDKHKVRLLAKGFAQKERVDYEETFAPQKNGLPFGHFLP
eukprot:PITA_24709